MKVSGALPLFGNVIIAIAAIGKVSGKEFIHVWPLGDTTCGYDVTTGTDALSPTLDACGPVGDVSPRLPYRALKVGDLGAPYIDLQVTAPANDNFAFALSVLPTTLSGVILDYRSSSACSSCVTRITAELLGSGDLSISVTGHDTLGGVVGPNVLTASVALPVDVWSFITIGAAMNRNKLSVDYVEVSSNTKRFTDQIVSEAVNQADTLALPGVLRLGAGFDSASGFFGEVTCASVENKAKSVLVQNTAACSDSASWLFTPPLPTSSAVQAYVFPLYNRAAGYDVAHDVSYVFTTSARDLRPSSDVTPLGHGSLTMDGSVLSSMDIWQDFGLFQKDFTLSLYVNFASIALGTALHVKASLTAGIQEIFLTLNSTHVTAVVKDVSATECGKVTTLRTELTWGSVSIGRQGNQLTLDVGASRASADDSCLPDAAAAPEAMATVRLGGSLGDGEGFHGNLACAVVFSGAFPSASSSSSETLAACQSPHTLPTEPVSGPTLLRDIHVALVAADHEPDAIFQPMTSFTALSLAACAKACQEANFCRSLTVSKVMESEVKRAVGRSAPRICRLYDQLTKTHLAFREGTKYYSNVSPRVLQTL